MVLDFKIRGEIMANNQDDIKICPNCGARMSADLEKGVYHCNHCDTDILMDESDEVRKERIRLNAYLSDKNSTLEANKAIEKEKNRAELEKSKQESARTLFRVLLAALVVVVVAGYLIFSNLSKKFDEKDHINNGDIKISAALLDFEDKTIDAIKTGFIDAGFTDIEEVPLNDLVSNENKNGIVQSIAINGNEHFQSGNWTSADSKIRITYHSISPEKLDGIQTYEDADYYEGIDYNIGMSEMLNAGFVIIELEPLKDLSSETNEKMNAISKISINGNKNFKYTDLFREDAVVKITYHSLKTQKAEIGTSSEDFVGMDYHTVVEGLRSAGFYNIEFVLLDDVLFGIKNNEVKTVTVNGKSEFDAYDSFEVDSRIVVTIHNEKSKHGIILAELSPDSEVLLIPVSSKDAKGKDYETISQQFEDAGFTNIQLYPYKDSSMKEKKLKENEDKIYLVTINGDAEFSKNDSCLKDSLIRIIYYSSNEESKLSEGEVMVPFSSSDVKSKNSDDIIEQLKNAGFTNIQTETIKDINPDAKLKFLSKKDKEIEKVKIGEQEKYEKGAIFQSDIKITVVYHTYKDEKK